jgi:hypothetical protein
MDIALKGKLNAIETAEIIDSERKTPIIYYSSKNDGLYFPIISYLRSSFQHLKKHPRKNLKSLVWTSYLKSILKR